MHVSGDLKIVATADLGELGNDEAVTQFDWPAWAHFSGLMAWLVLVPAFFIKENRTIRSLWILVPTAITMLAATLILQTSDLAPHIVVKTLVISYAMWWLLLPRVKTLHSLFGFLVLLIVSVVVMVFTAKGAATAFLTVMSLAILGTIFWCSHALARKFTRKNPTRGRFTICLALSLLVINGCFFLAYMGIMLPFAIGFAEAKISFVIFAMLASGFVTFLVIFAGALPFLLTAYFTDFYLVRFKQYIGAEDDSGKSRGSKFVDLNGEDNISEVS